MNKQKLIWPASILLGSIILGVFYFISQTFTGQSVERRDELKIQSEQISNEKKEVNIPIL